MVFKKKVNYCKKYCNIGSKTINHGPFDAIQCAPQIRVFGMVGAHEVFSCAFRVFWNTGFWSFPILSMLL